MSGARDAFTTFRSMIDADWAAIRAYRSKYNGEELDASGWPSQVLRRVGFQMMVAVRLMHLLRDARVPLLPMVLSRSIRHLYGAEIHWEARFGGGVSIIHGTGLVIGRGVQIGERCIIFQNVTLGESIGRDGQTVGSPVLESNVHVMPGAVVLGPVVLGVGAKIGANAVITKDVPAGAVVTAGEPQVLLRNARTTTDSTRPHSATVLASAIGR